MHIDSETIAKILEEEFEAIPLKPQSSITHNENELQKNNSQLYICSRLLLPENLNCIPFLMLKIGTCNGFGLHFHI
jgi:hypothetical protein